MTSEQESVSTGGRVALVTGASRGIGRAMALALAAEGAHIVAVARTQGALEDLDDAIQAVRPGAPPATLVPLDLADGPGIDRLGEALFRRFGRLDVFVGAAGMLGALTPLSHVSPKTWDNVLAINLTANWRLLRSLDPLLRASAAGRVVFVTSGTNHAAPRAYWGPYAVSKAALNALALTYAAETATTSAVKVMLLNPGPVATRMRASAMPGEDPTTLPTPEALAAKAVRLCGADWTRTGLIYDFPTDSLQAPSAAAPVPAA